MIGAAIADASRMDTVKVVEYVFQKMKKSCDWRQSFLRIPPEPPCLYRADPARLLTSASSRQKEFGLNWDLNPGPLTNWRDPKQELVLISKD